MSPDKIVTSIEARAEVRQIRTMADGTINLILNLPEDCIPQAKAAMDWIGLEVRLFLINDPSKDNDPHG